MTRAIGLLCSVGVLLGLLLVACSTETSPRAMMDLALPENPLPPCPASPNCVRQTRRFDLPPGPLFDRAQAALEAIGASRLEATPEAHHIDVVFAVFLFKDDVALRVEPHAGGAVLHVRSASRLGYRDFGVNRRRLRRFFRALEKRL